MISSQKSDGFLELLELSLSSGLCTESIIRARIIKDIRHPTSDIIRLIDSKTHKMIKIIDDNRRKIRQKNRRKRKKKIIVQAKKEINNL